jgi:hypothetical protein
VQIFSDIELIGLLEREDEAAVGSQGCSSKLPGSRTQSFGRMRWQGSEGFSLARHVHRLLANRTEDRQWPLLASDFSRQHCS